MSARGEDQYEVPSSDGVPLRAWLASPPKPSAALVLFHGLTTDGTEHGAFLTLRDEALRAGLAVIRFDGRAHGSSGGTNEQLRLLGMRADADAIVALLDDRLGADLPVIPLGVSFGGAAAIHTASTRRPALGLVLWYAVADYQWQYGVDSTVTFTRRMRAAHDPQRDPAWAEMPVIGTDYHFPSQMLAEMPADSTFATLAGLSIPVLAYHGSRDTLVGVQPLRWLSRRRPNIELRIAWGAGHGFFLWRRWVIRRTVAWAVRAVRAG